MQEFALAMIGSFISITWPAIYRVRGGGGVVPPANGYVAEDGATYYVAENGATYYVQE